MKKLLYITNIPTPYRQKRFNLMQEIFPKYGIEFEVLYMAENEPNRKWTITKDSYKYKYKIYKGIHPVIGRFFAHFNPGLLLRLLRNDYDIAIIGGMASPTHWLAPFFISEDKTKIISVESNLMSTRRTKGLGAKIKKLLLEKVDGYQVTGNPQIEYIQYFSPQAAKKQYIKLPNLIDEEVFRDKVADLRLRKEELRASFGVDDRTQLWVMPVRLIEIKGIIPFLELLKGIKNIKLFILGDGVLKKRIEQYVYDNALPVILVGFVQQTQIIEYYAAADLFVLPSIKDASPLTPIEATASGLPILVSSRIGNLEDVLEENSNGWAYDPVNEKKKGKALVDHISTMGREELARYGERSLELYNKQFDGKKCIKEYAESIMGLME